MPPANPSVEEDETDVSEINTKKSEVYGQTLQESSCTKGSVAPEDLKRSGWSDCIETNEETVS